MGKSVAASLLISMACGAFSATLSFAASGEAAAPYEVLFTIPKGGDKGVTYLYENTPEMLPIGPSRLMVAGDNTFFILDSAGNRILRYDQSGKYLNTITLPSASSLVDAIVFQGELYAIGSENDLKLYRFSNEGKLNESSVVKMPKSKGMQVINQMKINDFGDLVVEITDSDLRSIVDVPLFPLSKTKAKIDTLLSRISSMKFKSDKTRSMGIELAGRIVDTIDFHTNTHFAKQFAIQNNGAFQLQTTEVMVNPTIMVDTVFRSYGIDGKFLGMTRSPAKENYINVRDPVSVASDGGLHSLITQPDGVKIVRLKLLNALDPVLSEPEDNSATAFQNNVKSSLVATAGSISDLINQKDAKLVAITCGSSSNPWRSRAEMRYSADAYTSNSKTLTSSNMDVSRTRCSDRVVPSQYLNTSNKTFRSVPYKWGGFDLPADFNNAMSNGKIAGNATGYIPSCSNQNLISGVDCSGFISRTWNLPTKYSTTSLPTISSTVSSVSKLKTGDILNYYNSHVRLVEHVNWKSSTTSDGVYVWESTVDPNTAYVCSGTCYGNGLGMNGRYDGVVYRFLPWSQFQGLSPNSWNTTDKYKGYMPYSYNCVAN